MGFDIAGALADGYSPEEIQKATGSKMDIAGALKDGYSPEEISRALNGQMPNNSVADTGGTQPDMITVDAPEIGAGTDIKTNQEPQPTASQPNPTKSNPVTQQTQPSVSEPKSANIVDISKDAIAHEATNNLDKSFKYAHDASNQVIAGLAGTAGEAIHWVADGITKATGYNVDTPVADELTKYFEDSEAEWKKLYPDKFNAGKLSSDFMVPMGSPIKAVKGAAEAGKIIFGSQTLRSLANASNVRSLSSTFLANVGMLKRDKIENATAWSLAMTAVTSLIPLGAKAVNKITEWNANRYIKDILKLTDDDIASTLKDLEKTRSLDHLTDFQKRIMASIYRSPQASASFKTILSSSDEVSSIVAKHSAQTKDSVLNVSGMKSSEAAKTLEDVQGRVKTDYNIEVEHGIKDQLGNMSVDIGKLKADISEVEPILKQSLLGSEQASSVLSKVMNSKPTTAKELSQLLSQVSKASRKAEPGSPSKIALDYAKDLISKEVENSYVKYALEDSKKVIIKALNRNNDAYRMLKEGLEKSRLFKAIIGKNKTPKATVNAFVNELTSSSSSNLTKQFKELMEFIGEHGSRPMFERSLLQNIVEKSLASADNMGGQAIDFVKLGEMLDNIPEGVFTSPGALRMIENLHELIKVEQGALEMVRVASRYVGDKSAQMEQTVNQTLGFSVGLKVSQALARFALRLVSRSAGYSVELHNLLKHGYDTPVLLDKLSTSFKQAIDPVTRKELFTAAKETQDLFNESTKIHNAEVYEAMDVNGNYFKQLSDAYGEHRAKDLFNISESKMENGIPYTHITDRFKFRWFRLRDVPRPLRAISGKLNRYFPNTKIVIGDETKLSGNMWTVSREDLKTPNKLSTKVLEVIDGKTVESKKMLGSTELQQLSSDRKLLISDDLQAQIDHAGLGEVYKVNKISKDHITLKNKNDNGFISIDRHTAENGKSEWTLGTIDMPDGHGDATYSAIMDWVHSLGPNNYYRAYNLTDINKVRASFNQINDMFRHGGTDSIHPSSLRFGQAGITSDMKVDNTVEGFKSIVKGLENHLEPYLHGVKLADATDEQLKTLAEELPRISARGGARRQAGFKSLYNARLAARYVRDGKLPKDTKLMSKRSSLSAAGALTYGLSKMDLDSLNSNKYGEMPSEVSQAELLGHYDRSVRIHGKKTIGAGVDLAQNPKLGRAILLKVGVSRDKVNRLMKGDRTVRITTAQAVEASNLMYNYQMSLLNRHGIDINKIPKDLRPAVAVIHYYSPLKDSKIKKWGTRTSIYNALKDGNYEEFKNIIAHGKSTSYMREIRNRLDRANISLG